MKMAAVRRLAILGALFFPLIALPAEPGFKTEMVGGTLGIKAKSKVQLNLTGAEALTLRADKTEITIPYRNVNTLEYGQNVSRRYAEAVLISPVLLLSKSRKHYLTLGFTDERDNRQVAVLRLDKGDVRAVLAAVEARTGKRVEYLDDESRKGKR
jgi:hypothetical protein